MTNVLVRGLMESEMQTEVGTNVAHAAELLRAGEVVAVPTETVYGLAGNALDDSAVAKVFEAKNRPQFNPLIVHVADAASAFRYAAEMPSVAEKLANAFWPGPLTLLLPKRESIPDLVTAGSPLVALRVPRHPLLRELLSSLDFPLAAPSANPSGYVSPTTATHVLEQLRGRIPYILDGGACEVGLESSIVGFDGEDTVLYREGGLAAEVLEAVLGVPLRRASAVDRATTTPGRLKSHYATTTPLYLGDVRKLAVQFAHEKCAVISFSELFEWAEKSFVLSSQKSLEEAARNLFSTLREADASGCSVILAEPAPEAGLGRAINDRLRRAQHLLKGM